MESYNEIYNELSTQIENLNNNREENNEIKASLNEYIEYLKPSIKIEGDVEKILFIGEFIFFICNDKCEVKYSKFLQTTKKNKIVIKDKNFKNLGEIELNSTDYCISEINEDKIYVIICIDNRLYKLVDNKLEIFYEMIGDSSEKVRIEAPEMFRVIGKRKRDYVKPYLEKLEWTAENDENPIVRIHSAGAIRITKKAVKENQNIN